jgi:hypothetical protein
MQYSVTHLVTSRVILLTHVWGLDTISAPSTGELVPQLLASNLEVRLGRLLGLVPRVLVAREPL